MCELIRIVAIGVLFSLFYFHNAKAEIRTFNQSFTYPGQKTHFKDNSFKDKTFVYTACDKPNNLKNEKNCTVIQQKFPYDKILHSCNVTLQRKYSENEKLSNDWRAEPFGEKYAVLSWGEWGSNPKYFLMIIELTSCKNRVVELDDPDMSINEQQGYQSTIVSYENYFEMFIESQKPTAASVGAQVVLRFDFDGILQPFANITKQRRGVGLYGHVSSIDASTPNNGYAYGTLYVYEKFNIVLVKPDGTEKILVDDHGQSIAISAANNLIVSCIKPKIGTHISCIQYNGNGEVKFEVKLKHDDEKAVVPEDVFITSDGGLLLKTTTYLKSQGVINFIKPISSDIWRINSEGKQVGSFDLNDSFKAHITNNAHFLENGDGYCAVIPYSDHSYDNIKILTKCFTEKDFTA